MARVPKTATAPAAPAAEAPAAPAPKATKSATAPGAKAPLNLRPKGEADTDKFARILGKDGKGVGGTQPGADGQRIEKKMAPQAMVIANLLEAAGAKGMTRKELCAALPAAGLVTRQPVERILGYYQKPLKEAGMITYGKDPNAPVAAPKAAKVAAPAEVEEDTDEEEGDEEAAE